MRHAEDHPDSILNAADNITRQNSESEDIDLAAEATDSAPAKSLAGDKKPTRRSKPRPTKTAKGRTSRK